MRSNVNFYSYCIALYWLFNPNATFMLRLHYVPGGHGSPVSDCQGQNGMDVSQRGATRWTSLTRRDCRGCRARFFNCQKICYGNPGMNEKLIRPQKNWINAALRFSPYQAVRKLGGDPRSNVVLNVGMGIIDDTFHLQQKREEQIVQRKQNQTASINFTSIQVCAL